MASLGAGFAADGTQLILWRILQGIGAAFLFANAAALVTDAFPREQLGLAMGTNTMVAAIGLVLGPVLGGALVSISWQWVFWFNVPLGLAAAAWGGDRAARARPPDDVRGLDLAGVATFVVGLTGLVLAVSKGGISGWNDPVVIGGLAAAAVLLPAFVAIERGARAPMLDLSIFRNRLFAAATGAAFINGLSRFALMFLFVFYFQGVKGDDPVLAGVKLAPMAIGMLVASPLAGVWADRHGSRTLAALGMLVSAVALAAMTMLGVDSPYWQSALWLALVGVGSGMFNSPNTAAMMGDGARPPPRDRRRRAHDAAEHRRRAVDRDGDGDRDRGGAAGRAAADLLRAGVEPVARPARPVRANMHTALWVLAATSLAGAPASRCCARRTSGRRRERARCASARSPPARARRRARSATTRRSGCSRRRAERPSGAHRLYDEADVERLQEVLRLKELLGRLARRAARAGGRRARPRGAAHGVATAARRARRASGRSSSEALGYAERQLELLGRRREEIVRLERELEEKRARIRGRLAGLEPGRSSSAPGMRRAAGPSSRHEREPEPATGPSSRCSRSTGTPARCWRRARRWRSGSGPRPGCWCGSSRPTETGIALFQLWATPEDRQRNADDPGHRAALEASGMLAAATGMRSRAFGGAALQVF